jgi:trans-2,3-dihydro-3-hydroxyanthranilate isomerase
MQAIAAEFNLSETVFPLPPTAAGADYRVRIFTPGRELPFAGHPSIGAAWVLARAGLLRLGDAVQECGAGLLPVQVTEHGARVAGGPPRSARSGTAWRWPPPSGSVPPTSRPVPAGVAGAGISFAFLVVRPDAVARAVPDPARLRELTDGLVGLVVAAVDPEASHAHVRMFAPDVGVAEDPATGSAAVALTVFLVDRGVLAADGQTGLSGGAGRGDRPAVDADDVGARAGRPRRAHVGVRRRRPGGARRARRPAAVIRPRRGRPPPRALR